MACAVEKDCKRASETVLRAFDLTWLCARKWRQGIYITAETRIRARPLPTGSEQPTTGYQYRARNSGWTGENEPAWPTETGGTVEDGSIEWELEAVTTASLERTIAADGGVDWDADAPMTVGTPVLDVGSGQVQISALHSGGTAGTKLNSWADVTFTDGTVERFQIQWKIIA